jgi:GNAT superfamily N-acetyltransferase
MTLELTIEVKPAAGRFDDVAAVLKPGGATGGACWCLSYRDGSSLANEQRGPRMRELCGEQPGPGVLLYVDGEVAGWCSVAPRSSYRRLMNSRTIPWVDERDAWSIVCFVIRARFRRRGLMRPLLDGAVDWARQNGAEVVEGYPVDLGGDRISVTGGYVGTVELFEGAGFTRVVETAAHSDHRVRWVMRRELRG